jgi:DHA1 family bicyclomycin/chloramphenicol resistance-like MFS transporter
MTFFFIPTNKLPTNKEPMNLRGYMLIFKSKPLMLLATNITFMFVPYWIIIGMSPILYMEDLGVSLSEFGYYQGSLAFTFAFGSILSGLIVNKYDQKKMLYISAQISIIGLIIIAVVTLLNIKNPLIITLAYLPFNTALIIPSTILYPICLSYLPEAKGRISAVLQGSRLIVATICLELAAYFYNGSFQNIGIILSLLITLAVITMFMVIKNLKIINLLKK